MHRLGNKSRMSGDVHVRFCERLEGRFLWATRLSIFSDDDGFLAEARVAIEDYLATLRLKIHPVKSQLFETRVGANFVGFRVLPMGESSPKPVRIRVRNDSLRRARPRLRRLQAEYTSGKITLQQVTRSIQSWVAHLEHGDTWHLRRDIFQKLSFAPPPHIS